MDKLKQNLFWVGLGVAGAVLVGGFMIYVFPLSAQQAKAARRIREILAGLPPSLPGKQDIQSWNDRRDQLKGDYDKIAQHYVECDSHLERWFPDLTEDPGRDSFMAKYRGEIQTIEKALQAKGVVIGKVDEFGETVKGRLGFNWEEPNLEQWSKVTQKGGAASEKQVLKELQKRYWIRYRVARVILDSGVKVRVHDFHFKNLLHPELKDADWEKVLAGEDAVHYVPEAGTSPGFGGMSPEFVLPDGLGTTLTFDFAIELPYSEVPNFIREFLNPSADAGASERLLVNLQGCHITMRQQWDPLVKYQFPEGDAEKERAAKEEERKKITAYPVLLAVTGQIIDFNPDQVKKTFEAPPPEAAAAQGATP